MLFADGIRVIARARAGSEAAMKAVLQSLAASIRREDGGLGRAGRDGSTLAAPMPPRHVQRAVAVLAPLVAPPPEIASLCRIV